MKTSFVNELAEYLQSTPTCWQSSYRNCKPFFSRVKRVFCSIVESWIFLLLLTGTCSGNLELPSCFPPRPFFSHFLSLNKPPFHFSLTEDGFSFKRSDKINWIIWSFFLLVGDQKSLQSDMSKLVSALCLYSELYTFLTAPCCLREYFNGMLKFPLFQEMWK